MSNDLISRSKLRKLLEESMNNNPHKDGNIASNHNAEHLHFLELIAGMPTAYDMDKIVEWLEESKSGLTTWAEDEAYKLGVEKAIEIIKAGMKG